MWSIIVTVIFATSVLCGPLETLNSTTDLHPVDYDKVASPVTDLLSAVPEDDVDEKQSRLLFLVNVSAVNNRTTNDSSDVLSGDFIKETLNKTQEPFSVFLLEFKNGNEDRPVNLDDVAADLKSEGLALDKVVSDNQTQMIKFNLSSVKNITRAEFIEKIIKDANKKKQEKFLKSTHLQRIKRKLGKQKGSGGGGGACCGGGGYQPQPVYQPVQPIYVMPIYAGGGGKPHRGGGGCCNPCGQCG